MSARAPALPFNFLRCVSVWKMKRLGLARQGPSFSGSSFSFCASPCGLLAPSPASPRLRRQTGSYRYLLLQTTPAPLCFSLMPRFPHELLPQRVLFLDPVLLVSVLSRSVTTRRTGTPWMRLFSPPVFCAFRSRQTRRCTRQDAICLCSIRSYVRARRLLKLPRVSS